MNKLSNQFLKSNGIFYTNESLANKMVDLLSIDYQDDFTILEPAVGEGHIFSVVVERFLKTNIDKDEWYIKEKLEQSFFAFDIREEAIKKCINKLDRLVIENFGNLKIDWNIHIIDALDEKMLEMMSGKFDYIISNPPYIARKHMSEEVVKKLRKVSSFCTKFNFDMYYYFFEIGLKLWNKKGKMVYITPNSYLRARSAEKMLDKFISEQLIESIIDFEDTLKFEDATTYTAISCFSKNNKKINLYHEDGNLKEVIQYNDLKDKQQVYLYDKEFELDGREEYIELGQIAEIKNGLATLNDKVFIIKGEDIVGETTEEFIINKEGYEYSIEKSGLRIAKRASEINQLNYIIFPYDKNNQRIENISKKFPNTYRYLSKRLSRDYMDKYGFYYGRTQGLKDYYDKKIIIPKVAYLDSEAFKIIDYGFVLSGLSIVFSKEISSDYIYRVTDYLNSELVRSYLSTVSKNYSAGYKSISSTDLKKIKLPKKYYKSKKEGEN